MKGRCSLCGGNSRDITEATLTDDSGGASIQICRECRERLETPRCQLCGDIKNGRCKAGNLRLRDEEADLDLVVPVCDACRSRILDIRRVPV